MNFRLRVITCLQDPHFVNKLLGKNFQVMQVHGNACDAVVSRLALPSTGRSIVLTVLLPCLQRMGKPVLMPFLQVR